MGRTKQLERFHSSLIQICDDSAYLRGGVRQKVEMLLRLASLQLNAARVSAWRYNPERTKIVCYCLYDFCSEKIDSGLELGIEDFPRYFEAMSSNRVIVANDARQHYATSEFTEKYLSPMGIYSMVDTPIYSSDGQHGVLCVEDSQQDREWSVDEVSFIIAVADKISLALEHRAWQKASEKLKQANSIDPLTGLENRIAFQNRLDEASAIDMYQRKALFVFGVDRFKDINDAIGYNQANEVLKEFSSSLRSLQDIQTSYPARISGDLFALWIPCIDGSMEQIIAEVMNLVGRQALVLPSGRIEFTVSLGAVETSDSRTSIDSLVRKAEIALARAKISGVGSHAIYDEQWLSELRSRKDSENDLLHALAEEQLVPFYQPIVDSSTGKVAGLEALVRWNHPNRGVLSPAFFLPLATEMRIMPLLGELMVSQVLKDIAENERLRQLSWISVNLSSEQLYSKTILKLIASLLTKYEIPGELLELEIVEELISYDTKLVVQQLNAIAELGVRFSIDDFGTGYSSLARLKHLPVSKIKIDRSFVDGLPSDESDCCIANSIIGMAKGLDLAIVAEGAENKEQADWLIQNECHYIQGYYFAKPMALDELLDFLLNE